MINIETIVTVLFTILALSVLVFAHEMGHFFAGKWLGFDVHEFAIGFGPKILKKEKNGTIFSLRVVPLGGFVAFDDEKNIESGELSFDKKPIWKRMIVLVAGSFMNIVVAFFIMILVYSALGVPSQDLPADILIAQVEVDSPAQEAGLIAGDEFIEIDGVDVEGNSELLTEKLQTGESIDIVVIRNDELAYLRLVPEYSEADQRYMIGIGIVEAGQSVKGSVGQIISYSTKQVGYMIKTLLDFLGNLVFKGEGAKDVGSIVAAVVVMSDVAQKQTIFDFLYVLAFISINLGVFNLLPIPPCDGFKVGMYLYEAIRGKKIPLDTQMKIQFAGFVLLFGLSAFLVYRDVVNIFVGG